MNQVEKMMILKKDLQIATSANDELLNFLLESSKENIIGEGIRLIEDDIRSDAVIIQYAAYLFRKRASPQTGMPRFLRWELNNMKFSEKYGGGGA